MMNLTFPDGCRREFESGVSGSEVVATISKSLLKKAVAVAINGHLCDLSERIYNDSSVNFIMRDEPAALDLIRHDTAHVMAEAVQTLYPGTRAAIGPVIENGFYYDFAREKPFTQDDLPLIEEKMHEIIRRDFPFKKEIWERESVRRVFEEKGEAFKVELIDDLPEGQELKIYRQGDWLDLCRGPHMPSTGRIGHAFKLMKVAGAYWRGDNQRPMLTRIYGTAWANEQDLVVYLKRLEEAEMRDHRRIGRELDLFHFQEEGPGVIFWHAGGWAIFQELISYMRRRLKGVYEEINTPQLLDKSLWETSGHWDWFRENMFKSLPAGVAHDEQDRVCAIRPMNCPGHIMVFKCGLKSYRDLPMRFAEFGIVHRYEPSGALHGLMRVRGFTQDDAHVFCTEEQLADECLRINDLILSVYADFGFQGNILIKLSTRPEHRVGSDVAWDHAESVMHAVLKRIEAGCDHRIKTEINPGEGAFYGPKFEYTLRDSIGREWQCGTIQVDFNLPERFGAFFIDSNGVKKNPVMIHRAVCGSLERFLGILIEHYAGNMPFWIAPVQVVVANITSDVDGYARKVHKRLCHANLRAKLDLRNEKITYKVREHSLSKIPVIIVCGRREAEEETLSLRRLGSREQETLPLETVLGILCAQALPPDLRPQMEGEPVSPSTTSSP
ncbi:MAG: threonine--tRNA ligase [Alphaproteobacteria bacterium]|nr:threonine--tRNA ligase [Alphaproteobacteria bacterium]